MEYHYLISYENATKRFQTFEELTQDLYETRKNFTSVWFVPCSIDSEYFFTFFDYPVVLHAVRIACNTNDNVFMRIDENLYKVSLYNLQ